MQLFLIPGSSNLKIDSEDSHVTGFYPVWYSTLRYCCKNNFSSVRHLYI